MVSERVHDATQEIAGYATFIRRPSPLEELAIEYCGRIERIAAGMEKLAAALHEFAAAAEKEFGLDELDREGEIDEADDESGDSGGDD